MAVNLVHYYTESETVLLAVGGAVFVLELWVVLEAAGAVRRGLSRGTAG